MASIDDMLKALEAPATQGPSVDAMISALLPRDPAALDPATTPRADDPWNGRKGGPPERFGDTLDYATEGPRNATTAFAKGVVGAGPSPTDAVLPDWLDGSARKTVAQFGDVAGTTLSALGTAYAAGAGLVGEIAGGNSTGERALARDLMLMGTVAVPELAGVSSTTRLAGGAAKLAKRSEVPKNPTQEAARAADDLGVTPSIGMQGKLGGNVAAALEKVPFAGSLIARDASRAVGDIETAFYRITAKIGDASTPDQSGTVLTDAGKRYVERFKETSERLYDEVGKHIPGETRVPLVNAEQSLNEIKAVFDGNPALAQKLGVNAWDSVISEAAGGGLSWQALRRFRSQVGAAIGRNNSVIGDDSLGDLKSLYGALTADMEAAATAAGKPAVEAWEKANTHYRRQSDKITKLLDQNASPERVFELFDRMTKADRTTSDIHRLRLIKSTMKPGEWRDVAASIVERLGKARPGQQNVDGDAFSAATFLTEWSKLSKEAKRELIPTDVGGELEKLAKVASAARGANAERNVSNTGTVMSGLAVAGGMGAAPITTMSLLGGAAVSAKAMTSLPFLRALNRSMKGDEKALRAMANGNGPFAMDARTLLQMQAANTASNPGTPETPSGTTQAPSTAPLGAY